MKRTKLMTVYSVFWFIFGPLGVIGSTLYLFDMSYVIYGSLGILFGILVSISAFGVLKMKSWAMHLPVFAGIFHLLFLLLEVLPDIVPPDIKGDPTAIVFWLGLDAFVIFYFSRKSVTDRFLNNSSNKDLNSDAVNRAREPQRSPPPNTR